MIPMRCKTCGGNILPVGDGAYGVCDSCGNTFLLPQAQQDIATSQPAPAATDEQNASQDRDAATGALLEKIRMVAAKKIEENAISAGDAGQQGAGVSSVHERTQAHDTMTVVINKLLWLLIILVVVGLPIHIYNTSSQRIADRYRQAVKAYNAQDYSTAIRLFESVKDYANAPMQLLQTKYLYGQQLISSGEYSSAVLLLKDDLKDNGIWRLYQTIPVKYRYVPGDLFFFGKRPDVASDIIPEFRLVWQLLDVKDDQFLVVSYRVLDCIPSDVEEASAWETSSLRAWLNSDFMNAAFSPAQQRFILPTVREPDTTDYLFLLSAKELFQYRDILEKDTQTGIRPAMWVDGNATGF